MKTLLLLSPIAQLLFVVTLCMRWKVNGFSIHSTKPKSSSIQRYDSQDSAKDYVAQPLAHGEDSDVEASASVRQLVASDDSSIQPRLRSYKKKKNPKVAKPRSASGYHVRKNPNNIKRTGESSSKPLRRFPQHDEKESDLENAKLLLHFSEIAANGNPDAGKKRARSQTPHTPSTSTLPANNMLPFKKRKQRASEANGNMRAVFRARKHRAPGPSSGTNTPGAILALPVPNSAHHSRHPPSSHHPVTDEQPRSVQTPPSPSSSQIEGSNLVRSDSISPHSSNSDRVETDPSLATKPSSPRHGLRPGSTSPHSSNSDQPNTDLSLATKPSSPRHRLRPGSTSPHSSNSDQPNTDLSLAIKPSSPRHGLRPGSTAPHSADSD